MYIRYWEMGSLDSIEVRDVRHFCIVPEECGMEDGSLVDGASIYDKSPEIAEDLANNFIQSLSSYLLGGEEKVFVGFKKRTNVFSVEGFSEDYGQLAWFESSAAAKKVLDEICKALDAGKQFFDLTLYGDDGNLLN